MEPFVPKLSGPAWRWIRFSALLLAGVCALGVAYRLRTVITPLLAAAALAYILNPAVTWLESVRRVPRLATVIVTFVLVGVFLIGGGAFLVAKTVAQLAELQDNVPRYVQTLEAWLVQLQSHLPPATTLAETPTTTTAAAADWWTWLGPLLQEHGVAVARTVLNSVAAATSSAANVISLILLIPVFTFYFLWRFNDFIRVLQDHVPAASRPAILHLVRTTDAAVANFFRGRLIVCVVVGTLLGIGWTVVGLPYGLPLGLLAGVLNLVPFVSGLVLPPALLLAYLQSSEVNVPWLWPVLLTMGVFMAVQAIESFVLSPLVEGRASGLHPLVIVVALLIGAELAGLLGLLLAVPVASTLKTLAAELVWPEVRRLAGLPSAPAQKQVANDKTGTKA